jgi:N-sulfoglucosamine sulfohydrolase
MRANFYRLWLIVVTMFLGGTLGQMQAADAAPARPNILWISIEDTSPDLGCYGDKYATTPVLDKFATESVRYTRCFTHAGVCAPSRSGLITGMYPPSITTQHMRCDGVPPPHVRCFTEYLRAAGYYCTNNSKTDYQFTPPITAWDANGNQAHWKNRSKDEQGNDKPFFAVFNLVTTHESQIRTAGAIGRKLPADKKHDPAKAVLPPYYPDTPLVRQDWANCYDNVTATEDRIAELLKELDDAGMREETIVWFWGDHGRGLPRAKRWLYDSGVRAPLMIRVPEKWRKLAAPRDCIPVMPGSVDEELHAFVDFAPTMLSLCGLSIPDHLQGQAFLGPRAAAKPREYVYGHRDRMDERYDLIRMVRDKRYKYLRNFRPDLPYAQHINYMDEMPTMQEWRRLAAEGKLNEQQKIFFAPYKPLEELYDTENDPHELVNLAEKPEQAKRLERMREECYRWMMSTGDTGLVDESIIERVNHPNGETPTVPLPTLKVLRAHEGQPLTIEVQVPNGGAVAYRLVSRGKDKANEKQPWEVLPAGGSLEINVTQRLIARGVRLGYKNSEMLQWNAGDPVPEAVKVEEQLPNEVLRRIVDRLYKEILPVAHEQVLENGGQELTPDKKLEMFAFFYSCAGFADKTPHAESTMAIRMIEEIKYLQVTRNLSSAELVDKIKEKHPAVAEQLKKYFQPTLTDLKEVLKDKNEFVRLHAAHALDNLGEAARPALADIEEAAKADDYAGRVCKFIVKKLK